MTTEAFKQEASRAPNTETVVKALEWREDHPAYFRAGSVAGIYAINFYAGLKHGAAQLNHNHGTAEYFDTIEEAKAAAQADFDQRIRSALASPPSPAEVSERIVPLEKALDGLVKKHIKRGPWHNPLPANEQSEEINAAVEVLNSPHPPSQVTITDEMVEAAAKALVVANGTSPLCLFEFNVFTGQEPFDHEDATGRRFIYAWRKKVDNARAALTAALQLNKKG